jgi:GSH-dependent disulfide-bond oxidoreductase
MIDCYTWKTSNGRKVTIMLEEIQIPYRLHPIDIGKDDQFKPEYVKLNPNSKIPTIVDQDGPGGKPFRIIESGAILMYLAEKTGKLMPQDTRARYEVIQWVMFQMGGIGPNFGQMHHFNRAAKEKVPYALTRFGTEVKRLYGVLDARLAEGPYLAGEYSIADICTYPWVVRHEWQNVDLNEFPNVKRWYDAISARPAVQKGLELP